MRKHLLSLAIAVTILGNSVSAAACVTDFYSSQYNHFTAAFQGSLIKDFNDYALIFEDAKTPDCSATARNNLYTKITTTGWHSDALGRWVPPYMGFLEGNQVALIYAAALMIGGNGDLNSNLDWALSGGSRGYGPRSYQYNPGPGCGWQSSGWLNGGDTCMEEHAAAAAAYAWIAAYESKRYGYWSASSHAYNASAHIDAALSTGDSICIYNPNNQTDPAGRGPCNVDVSGMSEADAYGTLQPILTPDPNTGRTIADVLSFNRGENMVYGAGQLTILNAALIGLEEAGYGKSLRSDQQLIAQALIDEAQRKSDSGGNWFNGAVAAPFGTGTCATMSLVNGNAVRGDDFGSCADGNARPKIFNLNSRTWQGASYSSFAERYIYYAPIRTTTVDHWIAGGHDNYGPLRAAFQFNEFDDSLFSGDANEGALGPGRKSMYKNLGWTWSSIDYRRYNEQVPWAPMGDARPRLTTYLDDNDPIGWLNGITDYGSLGAAVYGWACDRDRPDFSIKVQIVVDGQVVGEGWANYDNEPAVTQECGGGTLHRWAIAIPPWTKGHWVTAYGIDATWKGQTLLAAYNCPQLYACTW